MLKEMLENVKKKSPLVHNITNYVSINDCANILLACGGSAIMADDEAEVEEITSICDGLNINMGTLHQHRIPSMFKAGIRANELGHPVVLDPVGVGASSLRKRTASQLLKKVKFSVIRGNISEIKTLAFDENISEYETSESGGKCTCGVDADFADKVTEDTLLQVVKFAKDFSKETGAVIVITGVIDIVADSEKAYCIYNGNPMMSMVTGTGCQLSALTAAYVTANQEHPLEAAAAAVCAMGVCGEIAYERLSELDGPGTYRNYLLDAIYHLSGEELERKSRYEIF